MRALPDRVAFGSFSTELGDVKMCLKAYWTIVEPTDYLIETEETYKDKDGTPKEAIPRIVGVIVIAIIQEKWPLVARDCHFATLQLFFDPVKFRFSWNNTVAEDLLGIRPVKTGRTKQCPSPLVIEAPIGLDITCQRGVKRLAVRRDPVEDSTFKTLGVIGSCTVSSLLYLQASVL